MNEDVIIDAIQKVREKNNRLWMMLLRIAMKNDPDATRDIMRKVRKNDLKISELTGELANE